MPAAPLNGFDLFVSFITSDKFIAAFIGLISGTVATFIAPWTKWHFKEKELRREHRKDKIRQWRDDIFKNRDNFNDFKKTSTFQELKDKLSPVELKDFLFEPVSISGDSAGNPVINVDMAYHKEIDKLGRFQEIISQIEKEWKLI
jgi:hypothetical protein